MLEVAISLDFQQLKMTIEAWYMDDSEEDQRLPHKTNPVQPVSTEILDELGVLTWTGIQVNPSLHLNLTLFLIMLLILLTRDRKMSV